MLSKCCTQHASTFGKLSSGHRIEKGHFSFQSQRRAMPKIVQTTAQLHSSHTLAKYVQNSPSHTSTVRELRTFRCSSWIWKRQRMRNQIANIHWNIEKAREFQKSICFIICSQPSRHLPAHLPDTRQLSYATPACSSA